MRGESHGWFPFISRLVKPLVKRAHFYLDDVSVPQCETELRLLSYKISFLCVGFEINFDILSFLWPAVPAFTDLQDFFL